MASFVSGDVASYGNSSVEMGGVILGRGDSCSGCDKDFEIEDDSDGDGNRVAFTVVPIDCGKFGKFCSERCQWQAAYVAATPEIQARMKTFYKGLALIIEGDCKELREHLEKFDTMHGPYASSGPISDVKAPMLSFTEFTKATADLASQFDGGGDAEWTVGL